MKITKSYIKQLIKEELNRKLLLEVSSEDALATLSSKGFKKQFWNSEAAKDLQPEEKEKIFQKLVTVIQGIAQKIRDTPDNLKGIAILWLKKAALQNKHDLTRLMEKQVGYPTAASELPGEIENFFKLSGAMGEKSFMSATNKDINNISNISEFKAAVRLALRDKKEAPLYNKEKYTPENINAGTQKIITDSPDWEVIIPITKTAACYWGEGTTWCTAAPGANWFAKYNQEGPLYIFINKKDPSEKYQLHWQSDQFMDVNDQPMPESLKQKFEKMLLDKGINPLDWD